MTITAQSIIRRVVDTLQDTTSIRWSLRELVRYLNDGQREIVVYRPDSMVTNATMTPAAGSRQTLPANGTKLIDVPSNTSGEAITLCPRLILDTATPGWHSLPGKAVTLHYMYDVRDPKTFYVYPPALVTGSLQLVYSALPTDIAQPAEGAAITPSMTDADVTQVVGVISVPDIYSNTLADYTLYRAYLKDSEYAGNSARSQAAYASFANALGIEIKATVSVAPQVTGAKVSAA